MGKVKNKKEKKKSHSFISIDYSHFEKDFSKAKKFYLNLTKKYMEFSFENKRLVYKDLKKLYDILIYYNKIIKKKKEVINFIKKLKKNLNEKLKKLEKNTIDKIKKRNTYLNRENLNKMIQIKKLELEDYFRPKIKRIEKIENKKMSPLFRKKDDILNKFNSIKSKLNIQKKI